MTTTDLPPGDEAPGEEIRWLVTIPDRFSLVG